MSLETRLFALLVPATPALEGRWFPVTAEQATVQGAQYPYGVYFEVSGVPILTQDQQASNSTSARVHRYQFSIFSQVYDEAALAGSQLEQALVAHPREEPGLQAILPLNRRWGWAEADRIYQRIVDLEVTEDFAE